MFLIAFLVCYRTGKNKGHMLSSTCFVRHTIGTCHVHAKYRVQVGQMQRVLIHVLIARVDERHFQTFLCEYSRNALYVFEINARMTDNKLDAMKEGEKSGYRMRSKKEREKKLRGRENVYNARKYEWKSKVIIKE